MGGVGGMLTFLARSTMLHQHRCYATGWWGGGWVGWDVNVPCTLHQHRCYATGWCGGWGGWDVNVPWCTNIDATQQGGVVGGVGGMLTFLARCTNIDATQQGGGVVGVPCTLHQHRCYATGWWGGGWGGWDVNVPCTLHQHRTCLYKISMGIFTDFAVGPQNTSAANGDVTLLLDAICSLEKLTGRLVETEGPGEMVSYCASSHAATTVFDEPKHIQTNMNDTAKRNKSLKYPGN